MANSPLATIVFVIENGQIIEAPISAFSGFIDETTTPRGVASRFHVRGAELWTWGHAGNFPKLVSVHDTEADAIEALEETFVYDFWNCSEILAFRDRASAEKCLVDCE